MRREKTVGVEEGKELTGLAGGDQAIVSLRDLQSYYIANYGVGGNVPTAERS